MQDAEESYRSGIKSQPGCVCSGGAIPLDKGCMCSETLPTKRETHNWDFKLKSWKLNTKGDFCLYQERDGGDGCITI